MREEDVLQVLGGSFFNSVLVDIEKEYIYADEFCTVVVKNQSDWYVYRAG